MQKEQNNNTRNPESTKKQINEFEPLFLADQ